MFNHYIKDCQLREPKSEAKASVVWDTGGHMAQSYGTILWDATVPRTALSKGGSSCCDRQPPSASRETEHEDSRLRHWKRSKWVNVR